jgi:predicted CXXCH cytochrome family protein
MRHGAGITRGRRIARVAGWSAVLGLLPIGAVVSGRAAAHPARPSTVAEPGYVDSAVCAGCHGDIAKAYLSTGMGRSFSLPDAKKSGEDFGQGAGVDHHASNLHYRLLTRGGKLYERRFETGPQGEETNVAEERVDYVIGSGNHARTFLHRDAVGRLIELPVSWYAEGSGYFAMSPGYDRPDQEDFRRAIPAECMFCHNGYVGTTSEAQRTSMDPPPFPARLPMGIECQRCHGPGEAHVRAAASGASEETIRGAIVNPARLSRDRQLEVCMQCHLETSSSHMPNEIRRYNRAVDSYRPGQPLGDYKLYFDPIPATPNDDRFEIAHAAYRLRMSACFRNSSMTCLTCHDPHRSYRGPEMTAHYIAACQRCHQSVAHKTALPAGSTCISCHMPERRTDDAVHVVMTDHFIQRVKANRDLLAPLSEAADRPGKSRGVRLYYPPQISATAENELYLAVADVKDGAHGRTAVERLRRDLMKDAPAEAEFYFELAHACAKADEREAALHWYEEALRRRADYPAASEELALLDLARGDATSAVAVLQKAVARAPGDDQLLANLGNVYLRAGRPAEAQKALERALQLNPELAEAANLMGLVALQQGSASQAAESFRTAVRLNPAMAEARENLGRVLASGGNYEEAAFQFHRAIAAAPKDAEAHHSYALMLEVTHAWDDALRELKESVRLNEKSAQTHDDLGDLLAARGDAQGAAGAYERALALKPGLVDARLSLAGLLANQGKLPEAEKQFRAGLAVNPGLAEAHLGLATVLAREGKTAEAVAQGRAAMQSPDAGVRQSAQELLRQLGVQ